MVTIFFAIQSTCAAQNVHSVATCVLRASEQRVIYLFVVCSWFGKLPIFLVKESMVAC